jgi:hypothetical protein
MNQKPLNPKLPGRYGKMTRARLDALVADLDRPIPLLETRALTAAERRQWQRAKRRPGRPRRGLGVRVISLSVEQSLLEQVDAAVQETGLSRAAIFEACARATLERIRKLAG